MFKFAVKLMVVTFVVVAACLALPGEKASAANANCPANPSTPASVPPFGFNQGEADDGYAGMVVSARVGTYTSPDPNNGAVAPSGFNNPIDTSYRLNSQLPSLLDPAHDHYYNPGNVSNLDARIFQLDASGQAVNRFNSNPFSTGETLYAGGSSFSCSGWGAFGPGKANEIGNRWALDCGQAELDGSNNLVAKQLTHFWLSSIPNYNGQSGYWEIQTNGNSYTNGTMDYAHSFNVVNGATQRVYLIWHANPPPKHNGPDLTTECTNLYVRDGGTWRRPSDGKVFSSGDVRTRVRVEDGGGHVLVHPANDNPSRYFYLNDEDRSWSYTPQDKTVNVSVVREYRSSSGVWNVAEDNSRTHSNCYGATCTVTYVAGNVPGGAGNAVLASSQFTVDVSVTNSAIVTLGSPSVNGRSLDSGYLDHGDTGTARGISVTAPGGVQPFQMTFTVNDGVAGNLASCTTTVPVYQKFNASGLPPKPDLLPTDENPTSATFTTKVTVGGTTVSVYIPTVSCGYKQPPYSSCAPGFPSNSGGIYNPGETPWTGTYAIPPGTISAGDQYCARIQMGYTSGYVGPGGPTDIVGVSGPFDQSSCDKVTNKPYFKAFGSGVSAGVALKQGDNPCNTNSGGLLAGWNNNSGGQERGAGSQLSALALVKITGFASAQTNITRSPTDLTFANRGTGVSVNTSAEDPDLGGNFNGSGYCANNVLPAATTTVGGPNYGGNSNVTGSQSVFVNGDVTITNDVKFGATPAGHPENAPSFVLHATGNIRIAPNVTRLDGMYVSDQNIYTCATASADKYHACNNQLLVHGSFVANQVKLQRTFGSLRDEEPDPATPASSLLDGAVWKENGPIPGMSCLQVNEPADPNTWQDNYLCLPAGSPILLGWTYDGGLTGHNAGSGSVPTGPIFAALNAEGKCAKWNVSGEPDSHGWDNNYLCANQSGLTFSNNSDPAKACIKISESADPDAQWTSGYYLCAPKTGGGGPTAKGPPYNACSNKGIQATNKTCAAEVFELAPELYLSAPATDSSDGCNSPTCRWDAVTGLPPVL